MNAIELSGVSAGLGALGMAKRLRRLNEEKSEGSEVKALKNTAKTQQGKGEAPKSDVIKKS